jgi:hypothetical protein
MSIGEESYFIRPTSRLISAANLGLVERCRRVVPGRRDRHPPPRAAFQKEAHVEHSRLGAALEADIGEFPGEGGRQARVDSKQIERGGIAAAPQPVEGSDEVGGRGEPFDGADLDRPAGEPRRSSASRCRRPPAAGRSARRPASSPPSSVGEGRIAELENECLAGREERPVEPGALTPSAGSSASIFSRPSTEQSVGGAVVAARDHQAGEAVEGDRRAFGQSWSRPEGRDGAPSGTTSLHRRSPAWTWRTSSARTNSLNAEPIRVHGGFLELRRPSSRRGP